MEWIIILVIGVAILVAVAVWAIKTYNNLIELRTRVEEGQSQIATQLQRRYDLIPNLVETVKGYAAHESETFESVTRARNTAGQAARSADPKDFAKAEAAMGEAMVNVNAVAEAYPELKANTNFQQLQDELTGTENRVAASRQYYNDSVYAYNTKAQTVPSNIIANLFNFEREDFFEVTDEKANHAPDVQF